MSQSPSTPPGAPPRPRPTKKTYWRRRLVALDVVAGLILLAIVIARASSGGAASSPTTHSGNSGSSYGPPTAVKFLPPPGGSSTPGHLQPGSDPSVLPGPILIADRSNNRLLIVDPEGRIVWQFPQPGDLRSGQSFLIPDDAFFSPDGRQIIVTQEDDFVITVIDVVMRHITWRYGVPGVPGSGPNRLWNPDDAMLLRDGYVLSADIKNCRIVLIAPGAHSIARQLGTTGSCAHVPPSEFGSPNGVFPMRDGHYLVTEINGDWVDEMSLQGKVFWATNPPGVAYPSDTNEISPNRYLTVDYSDPGQVVIFNSAGKALWRFAPTGANHLDHPSLALPLPNGDILLNDDHNDRVIVVDPRTNEIVWQYGHTGVAGSAPGYLDTPDGVDLVPPYNLLGTHAATMGLP